MEPTSIKNLDDQELIRRTEILSGRERYYTKLLLEHLCEIEERRLHLKLGYESIFAYCTKALHYSENEAITRIGAARLLRKIPEAANKIESGELTITNAGLLQGHLRRGGEEKSKEEQLQLLNDCANLSARKCKQHLETLEQESGGVPSSEVTVTLKVRPDVLKKIEELKKLRGIAKDSDLINLLCEQELEKEKEKEKTVRPSKSVNENSRIIPKRLREELLAAAGHQCTYISPITGKRCEATTNLEVDHVFPFGWGGLTNAKNCRIVCRAHNNLMARESFGDHKIDQFYQHVP